MLPRRHLSRMEAGRDADQALYGASGVWRPASPDCTSAKQVLIGQTISKIATAARTTVDTIGSIHALLYAPAVTTVHGDASRGRADRFVEPGETGRKRLQSLAVKRRVLLKPAGRPESEGPALVGLRTSSAEARSRPLRAWLRGTRGHCRSTAPYFRTLGA